MWKAELFSPRDNNDSFARDGDALELATFSPNEGKYDDR